MLRRLKNYSGRLATEAVRAMEERLPFFADLEADIHRTFQNLADQVVAGVLAQATATDDFAQDAKKK